MELTYLPHAVEAEVEHSKSLQAKAKPAPVAAGPAASSSSTNVQIDKLREEKQDLTDRMNLSEDLSGLTVTSIKTDENGFPIYNCILQDCLGKVGGEHPNLWLVTCPSC
jgi:hypothetical protein